MFELSDFGHFFINNFFLICLAFSTIIMVANTNKYSKLQGSMPIYVVCTALILSILYAVEIYAAKNPDLIFLATLCCSLGFILRPCVLIFFMRLSFDRKYAIYVSIGLVAINAIIYLLALLITVPEITHVIFYYKINDAGTALVHVRGPLFYFSHIVVGIMMTYFIVYSIISLKGVRKYDATASLICAAFVGIAVLLETLLIADNLLNTTIAIACLFYVVHLYRQAMILDPLTGLFDRKIYYADLRKHHSKVTGVIAIDMNALKVLNDTEGHKAGDMALVTIAHTIQNCIDPKTMTGYRMGGDEFIVLSLSHRDGAVEETVNKIREAIGNTPYSISIGFALREDMNLPYKDTLRKADAMMYVDKEKYYDARGIDHIHHHAPEIQE